MSNLVLQIKNLSHTYNGTDPSLNEINLEIKEGEKVSILGNSGCGKSTLLRLIAGFEKPSSGQIFINGLEVSSKTSFLLPEKRNLGLVLNYPSLGITKAGFDVDKTDADSMFNVICSCIDHIYEGEKIYPAKDSTQKELKDFINIDKTDTQIIVTGTNTSGCVYKSKSIGAYHWSKAGFKTKIYLPMTIEYEQKGINDLEKNINGFATLYNEIKKDKCFDIDIVKNFNDLKLPV